MRSLLLVVGLLAVVGLCYAFWPDSTPVDPGLGSAPTAPSKTVATTPEAASGVAASLRSEAAPAADGAGTAVRTAVTSGAVAEASALVSGRLVDRSGAPRREVEVRWHSWKSSPDYELLGSAAFADEREFEGRTRTDADGRFRFSVAKGRVGRLSLDVEHLVLAKGRESFSTDGGDADLGDLVTLLPARIAGVVRDEAGKPIEGVRLGADQSMLGMGLSSSTSTDSTGAFTIGGLQAGTWHVRTLSPQFLPAVLDVEVADEEQKTDLVIALGRGNAIAGQVVDDRGVGIAGVKVGCMRREKTAGMEISRFAEEEATTTDARGFFTLGGLAGETAAVRATHAQHERAMANDVRVGTGNLVMRMARFGSVSGVLRDSGGKPIAGSRVSARRAVAEAASGLANMLPGGVELDFDGHEEIDGGLRRGGAVTAADGTFTIDGVRPGPITVRARGERHRPTERAGLQLAAAQKIEGVALVAQLGSSVRIQVVDEKGDAVVGAEVTLQRPQPRSEGNGTMIRTAVRIDREADSPIRIGGEAEKLGGGITGADGFARIAGLPSGDAEASGKHESFASSTAVATVLPADGEIELRLVLRTGGSLRVNVTDARGVGVAAEFVVNGPLGAGENAEKHKDTSSADGIGTMGQLPPGNYEAVLQQKPKTQTMAGGSGPIFIAGNGRSLTSTRVPFVVEAGRETAVTLRLPTMATVNGVVTGSNGPTAGVEVELSPAAPAVAGGTVGFDDHEPPGLNEQSVTTDANGAYALTEVLPGRYRLRWGKPQQLVKDSMDLEIHDGEVEIVRDLRLRHGRMTLVVVDPAGQPIEGADIELIEAAAPGAPKPPRRPQMMMVSMTVSGDSDGNASTSTMTLGGQRAQTDVDGEVALEDVPPGRYIVRISHDRYAKREVADQEVLENATTDVGRVQLDTAGRIRGRVLDADGKPVRMVLVSCRAAARADAEPERQPAMTGSFTFAGLAAGRYLLQAQPLGGGGSQFGPEVEVDVEGGKTKGDIELRLPAR